MNLLKKHQNKPVKNSAVSLAQRKQIAPRGKTTKNSFFKNLPHFPLDY